MRPQHPRGGPRLNDLQRIQRWLLRIVIDPDTGCWLWQGQIEKQGYAQADRHISEKPRTVTVHRELYKAFVEDIPDDIVVHHKCRVRSCVYPGHMAAMTRAEHLREHPRDYWRISHCKRGHFYSEENTRLMKNGSRVCRKCAVIRAEKYAMGRAS